MSHIFRTKNPFKHFILFVLHSDIQQSLGCERSPDEMLLPECFLSVDPAVLRLSGFPDEKHSGLTPKRVSHRDTHIVMAGRREGSRSAVKQQSKYEFGSLVAEFCHQRPNLLPFT